MTKSHGPELRPQRVWVDRLAVEAGGAHERIVRRNGVKRLSAVVGGNGRMRRGLQASRPFVHVNAQNSRIKILVDALGVLPKVILVAFITHRDVQVAVRPEVQVTPVM